MSRVNLRASGEAKLRNRRDEGKTKEDVGYLLAGLARTVRNNHRQYVAE